jgi:hypothetical protein
LTGKDSCWRLIICIHLVWKRNRLRPLLWTWSNIKITVRRQKGLVINKEWRLVLSLIDVWSN